VPSAAWIDEEGRIVRIDEGTYSQQHEIGEGDQKISFGTDVYSPALKDWIAKGAQSEHVQSKETVTGNIRQHTPDQLLADACFRLANLFREHGQSDKAEQYWEKARELNPDSVNFIRQNLTLTAEGSAGESFMNLMGDYISQGRAYYRPMDIESK
jgi:tetratricopeptide (TPR) repeat protein